MNKSFSPALYIGITLALGKMPELKDKLQMNTKGFEMDLMTLVIMFILMPSYPVDFFYAPCLRCVTDDYKNVMLF